MEKKSVVVADDFPIVGRGLQSLLSRTDDLEVVAVALNPYHLQAVLKERRCDVILLDSGLPGTNLGGLLTSLKTWAPKVPVLLFTPADEEYTTLLAFQSGVRGHILKSAPLDEILKAVRTVAWGGTYLSGSAAEQLAGYVARTAHGQSLENPDEFLSKREHEILLLLTKGYSLARVGRETGLSPKTIGTYKVRLMEKLGVRSMAGLLRYAIETHLEKGE